MIQMEWTDDLNTNIDMLDKQHVMIVRAINILGLGAEQGTDEKLMSEIFSTLADTVVSHFAYEEEVFFAAGYPEAEAHKKVHADFVERAVALQERLVQGGDGCNEELVVLISWLKAHILGTDMKFVPLVREKENEVKRAG